MASREEDKAMEGLLRRSLANSETTAQECPEPDILAAYAERSMTADENARYETHFSQCARCREQLAAMARASEAQEAASESVMARPRMAWALGWNWLAPAGVLLALALVWFIRVRVQTNRPGHTWTGGLVAMSRPGTRQVGEPMTAPPTVPTMNADKAVTTKSANTQGTLNPAMRARSLTTPSAANQPAAGGVSKGAFASISRTPKRVSAPSEMPAAAPSALVAGQLTFPIAPSTPVQSKLKENTAPVALAKAERPARQVEEAKATPEGFVAAGAAGGSAGAATGASGPSRPAAAPAVATAKKEAADATNALREVGAQEEVVAQASAAKQKKAMPQAQSVTSVSPAAANQSAVLMTTEGMPGRVVVQSPDTAVMWRTADAGFVEHSTDGGATWQGSMPSPGAQFLAGSAPTVKVCWLVGRDGLILLTKDAKTWKRISPPARLDFVSVTAADADEATLTAADGRKFTTEDSGKKWHPAD
jgi:hypothetical protein